MDEKKIWKTFEKTGSIFDYLNYTTSCSEMGNSIACCTEKDLTKVEEKHAGFDQINRDCLDCNANFGI